MSAFTGAHAPTHASEDVTRQVERICAGAAEVISPEELAERLRRVRAEGRPLRVKLGVDPSSPDLHLGHAVVLRKLRQFQELGHEIVLIIGGFTARIGDPTGKKVTRPQLSAEQVAANARTYREQAFRILDPARTRLVDNSQWLEPLSLADVIRLASQYTVARMLEREDFRQRFQEGQAIAIHELLYPLAQAYDSVAIRADVELGGTDQKFNLMVARDVQRAYGQDPEIAVLMPLLEGTDGVEKMSKSLGNYIGITEPPGEIYGKTMSIPDTLIARWLRVLSGAEVIAVPPAEAEELIRGLEAGAVHPRDAKMRLAREIVRAFHGDEAAAGAEEEFVRVFRQRELPAQIPEIRLPAPEGGRWRLVELLAAAGMAASHSEARRLIRQGAVRVDGRRVLDEHLELEPRPGTLLQVGKRRFARLV